jgi:hypothetical protein
MFLTQVFDLLAFDKPDAAVALGEVMPVLGHPRCGYQNPCGGGQLVLPDLVKVIALAQGCDNRQRLIHRQRARRDCPCSSDGAWVWSWNDPGKPKRSQSRVTKRWIKIRNEKGANQT